jgi:hypothetical protein
MARAGGTMTDPVKQRVRRRLAVPRSYLVVAGVLVGVLIVQTLNRQWSGDWYLHAATVRELAVHPFSPHHPLVLTHDPDPDLSPYMLVLGLVVRFTHLDAVWVLSVAGIVNLLAFLVVLPIFVGGFTKQRQAATWTLVFALVLWGVNPWRWSGYLNLNSIGFGLPYPSMAATVLVLVMLILLQHWCRHPSRALAIWIGVIAATMALIHPPTALAGVVGVGAILVSERRRLHGSEMAQLAVAGLVALVLVALWPLYPFFSLLGNSGVYDKENAGIYNSVLPRVILLLLTLPALWLRWKKNPTDALVLFVIGGAVVFAFGEVSGHSSFGRTLPLTALAAQIALADLVSERVGAGERRIGYAAAAAATLGLLLSASVLPRFVPRAALPSSVASGSDLEATTKGWGFLRVIPNHDVVAVQRQDARVALPAFGGKTVSPGYPAAFVDDQKQRLRDELEIFATKDPAERTRLLDQYGVRWLLLNTGFTHDPANRPILALGDVVHRDRYYVLLRLHSD